MNSLSLFIYLANVLDNLSGYLTFICVVMFALAVIMTLFTIAFVINEEEMPNKKWVIFLVVYLVFTVFSGLFVVMIPNERTIYMIAASELGEQVVTNPEAQEVMTALKERIMLELKGTPSE